jgi:Cdc6-like AAA superfamily ATPase
MTKDNEQEYDLPDAFAEALEQRNPNILFLGPSDTGKTAAFKRVAKELGERYTVIDVGSVTSAADLLDAGSTVGVPSGSVVIFDNDPINFLRDPELLKLFIKTIMGESPASAEPKTGPEAESKKNGRQGPAAKPPGAPS